MDGMKKVFVLLLGMLLLLSLTACGNKKYDVLSDLVAEKGEEKDGNMALAIGSDSYIYQQDGRLVLHRNETGAGSGIILGVSVILTGDAIETGMYEWKALVFYNHDQYNVSGTFAASEVSAMTVALPYDSITGLKAGDVPTEKLIAQRSSEAVKNLLGEFSAALATHGTGLTIADYGFVGLEK